MSDEISAMNQSWCSVKTKHRTHKYTLSIDNMKKRAQRRNLDISKRFVTADKDDWLITVRIVEGMITIYASVKRPEDTAPIDAEVLISYLNSSGEEISFGSLNQRYGTDRRSIKFIKITELLTNGDAYLLNDSLVIIMRFNIFREFVSSSHEGSLVTIPVSTFVEDHEKLFKSKEYFDLVITSSNNVKIKAHKAILTTRSEVFKRMFSHDMREAKNKRIDLFDIDSETIEEMLRYIYTDTANLKNKDADLALRLFQAADKYQLDRLKVICADVILEKLSVSSAIDNLVLSHLHGYEVLEEAIITFITNNFDAVVETGDWIKLSHYKELQAKVLKAVATSTNANKSK